MIYVNMSLERIPDWLRLKKTKYNDNSTEEEFSESDFFELEPYKPPTFK